MIPESANGVMPSNDEKECFSKPPHTDLFRFAEGAAQYLGQMCKGALVGFLLRVDIMQLSNGKMVVNEFESFEAVFASSSECETCRVQQYLDDFWNDMLLEKYNKVLNKEN